MPSMSASIQNVKSNFSPLNTDPFDRQDDEGASSGTLCDHRQILGVDSAEAGVMGIAGDAQVFVRLLLAEWTTIHMAEFGRANLKGHLVINN